MTLLLAAERPYPFLLADLLVTQPGAGQRTEVPLPSVGAVRVNKLIQSESPYLDRLCFGGLTTKLCTINRYLVVGCAGHAFFASLLIQRLKSQIGPDPIDRQSLAALMQTHTDLLNNGFGRLGLICLGVHGSDPHGYVVWRNCESMQSAFGITVMSGRGSALALDMLTLLGEDMTKDVPLFYPSEEVRRLSTGLGWAGLLAGVERISSQTFTHAFGAGFEVAAVINGEIQKANNCNLLYILIKGVKHRAAGRIKLDLWAPITLSRVFYDDIGNLLIARAESGTGRALSDSRTHARMRSEMHFFVKRFDAAVDLGQTLAKHRLSLNLFKGADYTVYIGAHVSDRLHSICVAFAAGGSAAVAIGRTKGGREYVECPLNFTMMAQIVEKLGL